MNYECKVVDETVAIAKSQKNEMQKIGSNDGKSRLFRLALSCTGEYAEYHLADQGIPDSATETEKKEAVLSAMNITFIINFIGQSIFGIRIYKFGIPVFSQFHRV